MFTLFTTESFRLTLDHYLPDIMSFMSKVTIIYRNLKFHNSAPCNYFLKNAKIIDFSVQFLI